MHVGTFTREGTWARGGRASCRRSRDLGITVVEMMPVADFAGRFGWGYDGVDLYAPTRLYGTPGRSAGASSIARTRSASASSSTSSTTTSGPTGITCGLLATTTSPTATRTTGARPSTSKDRRRRRASSSSRTRATGSTSSISTGCGSTRRRTSTTRRREHVIADDRARRARRGRARARSTSSPRTSRRRPVLVRHPAQGGYGVDALWNDDFHHTARGRADRTARGLLHATTGVAAGVRVVREVRLPLSGPVVRVAEAARAERRRSICRAVAFVTFLENHDQVANSRVRARAPPADVAGHVPGAHRADAARPGARRCCFRGRSSPRRRRSCIFADHRRGAGGADRARDAREFLSQFPSMRDRTCRLLLPPRRRRDVRALQAGSRRARDARARRTRCTAICWRCGATTRSSRPRSARASTARCSRRRRSCCASSVTTAAIAC